jgi:transcription antitermination factor NusG
MNRDKRHWAVGQVIGGHEVKAEQRLTLHGCAAYVPVGPRLSRPAGKRKPEVVWVPLLPGYMFLDIRTIDDWGRVHDVPWILGFLGDEGRPAVLSDPAIDQIREIEADAAVEPITDPLTVFVIGERLRIMTGPFEGRRAFVEWFSDGRVRLQGGELLFPVETGDLTNLARCA